MTYEDAVEWLDRYLNTVDRETQDEVLINLWHELSHWKMTVGGQEVEFEKEAYISFVENLKEAVEDDEK